MNLKEENRFQIAYATEQINGMLHLLPESVSLLVKCIIEELHNQNKKLDLLQQTVESQAKTIESQSAQIESQSKKIQELSQQLEEKKLENVKFQELIKSLKTHLKSKDVDLDALKRLLFLGGREQKNDSQDQDNTADKPQTNKNSPTRNRQTNKAKFENCDLEMKRYLDKDGIDLQSSNKEEASKKIPQEIDINGKRYIFKGWQKSGKKIEKHTTIVKVETYVPLYEELTQQESNGNVTPETIIGVNPEKEFLPKTVIGFNLMSQMIAERMINRIPLNRIARAIRKECSFNLTRQQLARYFILSSEWLSLAYDYLASKVLNNRIIHLDETFIHCQAEDNQRQYMLVFTSETGCFFYYTNSRSQSVPLTILQNHFDGTVWVDKEDKKVILSTDGWYNVEWLTNSDGSTSATLVGCMVHLRRYFWDVYDVHENHKDVTSEEYKISEKIINLLKFIFHEDKECKTVEERTKKRRFGEIRDKFNEIKALVDTYHDKIQQLKTPTQIYTGKFIKAVKYAYNQWEKFSRIMEDGEIPLDNSEAERAIRDFAVLRHSTASGFASVKGARAVAIFASFHETCKKHKVHLKEYLEFLFRYMCLHLPTLKESKVSTDTKNELLEKAMPWNFKKV